MSTVKDVQLDIELQELMEKQAAIRDAPEFITDSDLGSFHGGGMSVSSTSVYVPIYSTVDGTVSVVRKPEASRKCMERLPNGNRAFSLSPVNPAWKYETDPKTRAPRLVREIAYVCYLHPRSDKREMVERLGLNGQECLKSNLPTQFQLEAHMRSRHRQEWRTIEEAERKEREDRQYAAMMALAGNRSEATSSLLNAHVCDVVGCTRFFDTAQGLTLHKGRDHKE